MKVVCEQESSLGEVEADAEEAEDMLLQARVLWILRKATKVVANVGIT